MAFFNKHIRLTTLDVPRLLDLGNIMLIDGQVYDSATLSRKSSKLIEMMGYRDLIDGGGAGCLIGGNNLSAPYPWSNHSGFGLGNVPDQCWILDSSNSNVMYIHTTLGYFYRWDMSTNTLMCSAHTGWCPAKPVVVGQDTEYFYAYSTASKTAPYTTYMWRVNKQTLGFTGNTSCVVAHDYTHTTHLLYADQATLKFVFFESGDAGAVSITRHSAVNGFAGTEIVLSNAAITARCSAISPTAPNANREFWYMVPTATALQIRYNQANALWNVMTQKDINTTINWGSFTDLESKTPMYSDTHSTWAPYYQSFLVGTNKMLVIRAISCSEAVVPTESSTYNRWWLFDVSVPAAPVLLNTDRFTDNPVITSKFNVAPDGRFFAYVRQVGVQFYTFDSLTNSLLPSTLILINGLLSYSFDNSGRFWYLTNDYSLYFLDSTTTFDVELTVGTSTQTYVDVDLSNTLSVSARNYTGARIVTTIVLTISGSAVFTSNGTKTLQVTTLAESVLLVPVTVKGTGQIAFSAKPIL